jgi:hypothetical protein
MEHPNIKLEVEMKYEPKLESYVPHVAGLAEGSRYEGKMSFDECVDAILLLTDFLSSENLLEAQDNPEDMGKVSVGTEQLLLEALYLVHDRWHAPEREEEDLPTEEASSDDTEGREAT